MRRLKKKKKRQQLKKEEHRRQYDSYKTGKQTFRLCQPDFNFFFTNWIISIITAFCLIQKIQRNLMKKRKFSFYKF